MGEEQKKAMKEFSCQLISIGDEILIGNTVDTNSNYLARNLTTLGILVKRILTIPDDTKIVTSELQLALASHDLVITTGGLGPTWDDNTIAAVAEFLGVSLVLDDEAFDMVKSAYQRLHNESLLDSPEITPERQKMAIIPRYPDLQLISNTVGVAPGLHVKKDGSHLFVLPGVPREMKSMFPYINKIVVSESGFVYHEKKVKVPITAESTLAPFLQRVREKFPGCYVKSTPSSHDRTALPVIISSLDPDEIAVKKKVEEAVAFLLTEIERASNVDKITRK
ncbi:MAG: competence/damage-inducible protein A [Promethearchaeota archaeon]|jgi:molybdenum cofactor synthesis domain-containing protein